MKSGAISRRLLVQGLAIGLGASMPMLAFAQTGDFPSRPLELVATISEARALQNP